jgi:hypothetical protein
MPASFPQLMAAMTLCVSYHHLHDSLSALVVTGDRSEGSRSSAIISFKSEEQ